MRKGRTIIASVFLALGLAGTIMSGPAVSVVAGHAPVVHSSVSHHVLYHV